MEPTKSGEFESRVSVDYALTATKANFASLTSNADQKANIIIAITSLIFTISLGQIGEIKGGHLTSMIVLMLFSLASLLLAIISVTPNYRQRKKSIERMGKHEKNMFFFGHFSSMSYEEYRNHMVEMFQSDEKLYDSMLKDIYQMGIVLHKEKFKILFYSYRFFFVGLLLSCIIALVEVVKDLGG
jgi:hypothetical protein